jgi:CheY-like chemotaxis protein
VVVVGETDFSTDRRVCMRILVVDGNAFNRTLLSSLLAHRGYHAIIAGNGLKAWTQLQREDFGAVVIAYETPGIDGLELLGRMRGHPRTTEIPVFLTSWDTEVYDETGASASLFEVCRHFNATFIRKPFQGPFHLRDFADDVARAAREATGLQI